MPNSTIQITFFDDAVNGDVVSFDMTNISGGAPISIVETFQDAPRTQAGEIWINPPTSNVGEMAAVFFAYYFDLDFNGTNQFNISRVINVVTIEDTTGLYTFDNFLGDGIASVVINNTTASPLVLDEVLYLENDDNKCTKFKISIETTPVIDHVDWLVSGVVYQSFDNSILADNPMVIPDISRGVPLILRVYNASGSTQDIDIFCPLMQQSNLSVNVTAGIGGATVTVTQALNIPNGYVENPELELEYSLNGVDWQSENIFTGQANGDYTMYVRDQFGCTNQLDYTVNYIGTLSPFINISEANSLSFIEQQDIDYCDVHPNDLNLFTANQLTGVAGCMHQIFKDCDTTKIQFKSNYDTHTVTLRHEDDTVDDIPVVQRSANLGQFIALDCFIYPYAVGQAGIYFTEGDTYDELGVVNGTFTLNGNLPYFAQVGKSIEVVGVGLLTIIDIVLDEDNNRKVLIVENETVTELTQDVLRCYYNILDYEVFEFEIDWNAVPLGFYDVLLTVEGHDETLNFLSENIEIKDDVSDCLQIRYFNDNNRDIFYLYEIEHMIRIPFQNVHMDLSSKFSNNETDLTVQLISSYIKDGNVIEFEDLPRYLALKVAIACGSKYLYINDIGYLKNGEPKIEPIDNLNFYNVEAKLIKTNINYTTNRQGQTDVENGINETLFPPFLVDTEYLVG